ncbi:MAG: hypothetical protein FD153_43 [Rhodospirillaceae bacterium]|nr:MAG: hypothetical protein FD153_43 [Rhodospirillaceae bacterium]
MHEQSLRENLLRAVVFLHEPRGSLANAGADSGEPLLIGIHRIGRQGSAPRLRGNLLEQGGAVIKGRGNIIGEREGFWLLHGGQIVDRPEMRLPARQGSARRGGNGCLRRLPGQHATGHGDAGEGGSPPGEGGAAHGGRAAR